MVSNFEATDGADSAGNGSSEPPRNAEEFDRILAEANALALYVARYGDSLSNDDQDRYETRPIEHFEPIVRRIFAREPWGAHTKEDWPVRG